MSTPTRLRRPRTRHTLLLGGSALVLIGLLLTDPAGGISTALLGVSLLSNLWALLLTHISRKGWLDYPEADMQDLFSRARQSSTGSGLALVAIAIILFGLMGLFGRAAHAQGLAPPQQAWAHLPTLQAEIRTHWPSHPMPAYFGGLIDHESACPRASSCWRPTARLRTQREEGAGLGQLTRAWHPSGALRFDALAEMRDRHPALRQLDWASIYQRPDLQLRAVVLKSRDDWRAVPQAADPLQHLAFTDLAYNAGRGRVDRDRRACALKAGCDPGRWWGHVEHTCTASRAPLYGARGVCDISRHHVADVIQVRAPRYASALGGPP